MFLETAERLDPDGWYPMAVLGFGSDARFSEVTACQACDLDLADDIGVRLVRRHLVVARKAIAPGTKSRPKGQVRLLDAITTARLRGYWQRRRLQGQEALMFPPSGRANGALCRSHQGFQKFLDRVSDAADLPRMTSKVMRRTYLTLSHLDAVADALTQAQAGHATPEQTMAYIKPTLEARKQHARKMGEVLYLKSERHRRRRERRLTAPAVALVPCARVTRRRAQLRRSEAPAQRRRVRGPARPTAPLRSEGRAGSGWRGPGCSSAA